MKDFYYILGTDNKATPGDINAAYRKLAQKLQPPGQEHDIFLDSHFQDITEAYQLLSDPVKRRKYDIALKKNYQRRLYYFKIGHVNVAVMLTLILFTGLFGYYVMKSISGDKAKKTIVTAKPIVMHTPKHRKKHLSAKDKTIVIPAKAKVTAPEADQTAVKALPSKAYISPVQRVQVAPAIVASPQTAPVVVQQTLPQQAFSGNMAAIQSNQTGMVYLHQQASYTSAVVANIPNQAKVQVLERGAVFHKIAYGGKTGYVPKWTIPSSN